MKNKSIYLFLMLISIFGISCKRDDVVGTDEENYALIISYDKQEISYSNFSNIKDKSLLTTSDFLNSQPTAKREAWKIKIKDDGSCRMEVTMLEPTVKFGKQESLSKGADAEVAKIVYENNKAFYFNTKNKLIHTLDHEMPNYKHLLPLYADKAKKEYSTKNNQLKSEGLNLADIAISEYAFTDETMGNLIEKTFFDTVRNVLIKSELYTSDRKMISKDSMAYTMFAPDHFVPTNEWHVTYAVNINKQEFTQESSTQYLSVDIINNL